MPRFFVPLSLALVTHFALVACDAKPAPAAPAAPPAAPPTAPPAAPAKAETPASGAAPAAAVTNPLVDPAATATIGQRAPDFALPAADGTTVKLSDFKGKRVVLEWFNPECPFVKWAHDTGPLKDLAGRTTATGVVWLAINSGAPGKQGHGAETNTQAAKQWNMTHPVLLDETGAVGHAYAATNTPHMYIVDEKGALVYRGGLDNAPMGEPREGGSRVAEFEDSLAALVAGKPVPAAETKAWGCSVKYAK